MSHLKEPPIRTESYMYLSLPPSVYAMSRIFCVFSQPRSTVEVAGLFRQWSIYPRAKENTVYTKKHVTPNDISSFNHVV